MVIAYDHSNKVYGMYRSARAFESRPDLWLRDENGTVVGDGHYFHVDHAQKAAGELWAQGCLNMTQTGAVDGCFMDGCGKMEGTTWNHAAFISQKVSTMQS